MKTTASSYKGARTKSALVALLKERDFLEDTSEPLAKMTVKALVELLVHGDNHPRAQVVDAMAAAVDTNDTDEDDEEQDEDEGLDEDLNSLIGSSDDDARDAIDDEEDNSGEETTKAKKALKVSSFYSPNIHHDECITD